MHHMARHSLLEPPLGCNLRCLTCQRRWLLSEYITLRRPECSQTPTTDTCGHKQDTGHQHHCHKHPSTRACNRYLETSKEHRVCSVPGDVWARVRRSAVMPAAHPTLPSTLSLPVVAHQTHPQGAHGVKAKLRQASVVIIQTHLDPAGCRQVYV